TLTSARPHLCTSALAHPRRRPLRPRPRSNLLRRVHVLPPLPRRHRRQQSLPRPPRLPPPSPRLRPPRRSAPQRPPQTVRHVRNVAASISEGTLRSRDNPRRLAPV